MPTKTIYLSDTDVAIWDEATALAQRAGMSISKLTVTSLKSTVMERRGVTDIPLGFKIPASMKDPKALAREQAANDLRAQILATLEQLAEEPAS
jgi:hypothetical protein